MNAHTDWLEQRRKGLGSSDVAAVLGIPGAYLSPFDVWASKQGIDQPDNDAMKRGRYLERAVCDWYADDIGGVVAEAEAQVGPEDWMRATPDRWAYCKGAPERWLLEAKTARDADQWEDGVPVHYQVQARWQMAVCDVGRVDVAVFFTFRDEFKRYTLTRDAKLERAIVNRARAWWERHIIGGEQPELGGRLADTWLAEQFGKASGEWDEQTTNDDAELVREYIAAGKAKKAAKELHETLGRRLKERIGKADGIRGEWGRCKCTRVTPSRFDTDRFKNDHPDLYEQYAGEGRTQLRLYPKLQEAK